MLAIPLRLRPNHWWARALLVVFLLNLAGLPFLFSSEDMQGGTQNWDTRILSTVALRELHPLRWFWSDWPLGNGFYRPLPSLSFLLDARLWKTNWPLYRLQEFAAAIACALLVVWLVWELTQNRGWSLGAGVIFSVQQTDLGIFTHLFSVALLLAAGAAAFAGAKKKLSLPAAAVLVFATSRFASEVVGSPFDCDFWGFSYGYRAMGWPPGRTAVFMTAFGLVCLASFVRWCRCGSFGWLVAAFASFVFAIFCYEQAAVIPALLVGSALCAAPREWRRWSAPCLVAFAITAVYWRWHLTAIPMDTKYEADHRRGMINATLDVVGYLLPGGLDVANAIEKIHYGTTLEDMLADRSYAWTLYSIVSTIAAFSLARKHWRYLLLGILGSVVAYAPLAIARPLFHYLYLPQAIRSVAIVVIGAALLDYATPAFRNLWPQRASTCESEPVPRGKSEA